MKVMDCMVHPSLAEGTPNSVLEAMLAGIPVIATAVGGVPDIIDHGETGLLVEPSSANALEEAMKKMMRCSSLRRQFALESKQQVQKNFSPARQRQLLEMLYATMLGNAFAVEAEELENVVA
jgi:glycosyltransferase involved in cell wall biosynthesis